MLRSLLAFHGPSAAAIHPPGEETDSVNTEDLATTNLSSTLNVVSQLLVGGDISTAQDLSTFLSDSPNLLIATPGRLLELLSSPHVHCPQSSFEILILDEADRLLGIVIRLLPIRSFVLTKSPIDLGFKEDLQKILGRLPKQRRTGLFSASVSEAVDQIIRVGLRNPIKIAVKVKGINGGNDRVTPSR